LKAICLAGIKMGTHGTDTLLMKKSIDNCIAAYKIDNNELLTQMYNEDQADNVFKTPFQSFVEKQFEMYWNNIEKFRPTKKVTK
jgi:hypothetical protein